MMTTDMPKKIHEGQNIKRFREMLGIKQEVLAHELGEDWTQSKVSHLEAKDTIDPAILNEVAKILKIPVEAIRNFDEDAAITIVANTINCLSPLKDWTKIVNQFSHSKFRKYGKNKTSIYTGGEVQYSSGSGTGGLHRDRS